MVENLWHERREYPESGRAILLHGFEADGHHYAVMTFRDEDMYAGYVIDGMDGRYEVLDWAYCDELLNATSLWRVKK